MAKISNVITHKPIPLIIEGIFIRDMPAAEIEAKFSNMAEELQKEPETVITRLFTDLICDETGESFEDCQTFEGITETLSVATINAIVNAIPLAMMPTEENAKK